MTLKLLFDAGILNEDDDFVIAMFNSETVGWETVADNTNDVVDLTPYMNRIVQRITPRHRSKDDVAYIRIKLL